MAKISIIIEFSRKGNCTVGSSFGSIFLLFSMKVAGAHAHSSQGKSPLPPALIVAAPCLLYELSFLYTTHSANPQARLRFVFFFIMI